MRFLTKEQLMKKTNPTPKHFCFILIGFILLSSVAYSQSYLPDKSITDKIKSEKKDYHKTSNWELKGKLSSNFSFTNNKNYVGQTDGSIYQLNIINEEELHWRRAQHELLNNLTIKYGLSKTPQLEDIFKSQDQFKYMGTYLYRLKNYSWIGPFGRLRFSTSLFSSHYVSPNDEVLMFHYTDKSTDTCTLRANKRYKIVDAFEPMTIRGNLGFFANPYDRKDFKLNLKLGLGFQKIITNNGFVLADDSATSEIEFNQLEDSEEAGLEFETDVSGMINDNINWSLVANLFLPLNDSNEDIEGFDKLNTDIEGKLSSEITNNISLDYFLIIKRLPQIVEDWQIQNGIVVNISYTLF
jgi:hypothetical protein